MRKVISMSKAVAMIAGGVLVTSTASATVVFDGTSDDLGFFNGSRTAPPVNEFLLENNGIGGALPEPNLFTNFDVDAAGSLGDGTDNVVASAGEDTVRITAKLTASDEPTPGRIVIVQLSEFNASVPDGSGGFVDRHENFNFVLSMDLLNSSTLTVVDIPVAAAAFVFTSFPDGSGFSTSVINGILDSTTLGVTKLAFQDPTGDGVTSSNPLGFDIGIEIASVELVPEPASMALLGLGGLAVLRRRA